jgi:hypothetical protein
MQLESICYTSASVHGFCPETIVHLWCEVLKGKQNEDEIRQYKKTFRYKNGRLGLYRGNKTRREEIAVMKKKIWS